MLKTSDFVNYAHRGASEYLPENTFSAFYTGLIMGANGIETDVRKTKDGVLVLFHDKNLERVCGKIVAFEDFLQKFSFRDITFAIELKGADVERETADLLRKYNMSEKTVVTSFKIEYIEKFKAYAPEFSVGHLTKDVSDAEISALRRIGADEICPLAELLSKEVVERLHSEGFRVRAWGVCNEDVMRSVALAGADGMTVNFPDKLTAYIKNNLK